MNQQKKQWYLFLLLSFFMTSFSSCIKSFVPDIQKYDELLVVDGQITDAPGPYTVTLSKSSRLREKSRFVPYTNCTIELEDNVGNKVMLTEKKPGVYQTDSLAIQGVAGRSYKIRIATSEGEWYESNPEVLLKGLKIQSVYGELEYKSDPKLVKRREGYQFYVDAETAPTTDNYILWKMESTYKFKAEYGVTYYYSNGLHPILNQDTVKTCYNIRQIPLICLLNTNELQQREIKRFPLNYEDNTTKALLIRYSLNVSQLTIGKEAFLYWNTIKKIEDAGGEMFTQQPFQVPNNLKSITHPDKPVLGYFMAAGLSEKRIFINPVGLTFDLGICSDAASIIFDPDASFGTRPFLWPVFFRGDPSRLLLLDPECVDCQTKGVLVPPPYWID